MNITRIYALFLRQLYLIRHTPMRFVNVFAWGILDLLVWGFLSRYLDSVQQLTFSFVPVLLGAIIMLNFMLRVQQGVILSFLEDIWSRNFLNLFAGPLRVKEYLGGMIATSIVTSLAALVVFLLLALLLFGYNIFAMGAGLIVFAGILFLAGISLGIFAAALGLRYGPSAEWVGWLIPFLIIPFSGVTYPVSALPVALQHIAKLLPTSYAFEGIRMLILHTGFSAPDALIGFGLAVFFLLVAYYFFLRVYRVALKTGLIARYSAESASS